MSFTALNVQGSYIHVWVALSLSTNIFLDVENTSRFYLTILRLTQSLGITFRKEDIKKHTHTKLTTLNLYPIWANIGNDSA